MRSGSVRRAAAGRLPPPVGTRSTAIAVETADATALAPEDVLYRAVEGELDRLFPARKVQRVLLVMPPDGSAELFHFENAKNYHNHPPYGLGVIAATLRRDGIEVQLLNLNNAVLRAALRAPDAQHFDYRQVVAGLLEERLRDFDPDLVGVSAMFSMAHDSAIDCCRLVRDVSPGTPVVLGGVHFTNSFSSPISRDALLADLAPADAIFMYEAELAFRNFIRTVNRQAALEELAQVALIRTDPVIYLSNRAVPKGEDLDVMPAFDLMELDELSAHGKIGTLYFLVPDGTRIATSLSNRGCRAQCTFCSVRQFNGVGVRGRSVEAVVDELLTLRHQHGVRHVTWLDDDFLFDHRRALRLFNEMVRRDVGLTWDWSNGVIAASCTDELIAAAAAAGCIGLYIGMESGNPDILRAIKKPGNVRHFLQAAEVLRKYEQIHTRVYLMYTFPGETYGMIHDTLAVAREMNLDWHDIKALQPLPNTPIFETVAQYRNFSEISYNNTEYNEKVRVARETGDILIVDFERIFDEHDPKSVPEPRDFDAIWAHMFFHLNYERLFGERRAEKLRQAYLFIDRMVNIVVPRSGFAWYFRNYLRHRLEGRVDQEGARQLGWLLAQHELYRDRFRQLGMPLDWFEAAAA